MPTICRFAGITIRMYYRDHGPPHFHAYAGDAMAVFDIETLKMVRGSLPRPQVSLVVEWAMARRRELLDDWRRAEAHLPLVPIDPLEADHG